jgi:hypothetical protein
LPDAGEAVELRNLRGPIRLLDFDIGEGECSVLLQEVPHLNEPRSRRPADQYRAVWVRFGSMFCCSAFLPECAMNSEKPGLSGSPVMILQDSHFLDYLKASSALEHVENLQHWMFQTFDGTLNVVSEEAPITEFVPVGWTLEKPARGVQIEPPCFPGPRGVVGTRP